MTKHHSLAIVALVALGACGGGALPLASADMGAFDQGMSIDLGLPGDMGPPRLLSQTGLYADIATRQLAYDILPYSPRYPLWSDGADKARYMRLPPGTQIDTDDMDNWVFPQGTKFWKEFSQGGKLVETRLLEKVRDGKDGWLEMGYAWNEAGTDAVAAPDGVINALGTIHDIPSQDDCYFCHRSVRDTIIGFSAIQLSSADGRGLLSILARAGLLSRPPLHEFQVPGQGAVQEALGYLHGNCGHCHNDDSFFHTKSVLRLRLRVSDTDPELTPTYRTAIGVKMFHLINGTSMGVVPGQPEKSQLYVRMSLRDGNQMPPICTKRVDTEALATIRAWIDGLH